MGSSYSGFVLTLVVGKQSYCRRVRKLEDRLIDTQHYVLRVLSRQSRESEVYHARRTTSGKRGMLAESLNILQGISRFEGRT